jgi:hypothetical protein
MAHGNLPQFYFDDSSGAIAEAFNQQTLGNKVSVGREVCNGKWYVRILGTASKGA